MFPPFSLDTLPLCGEWGGGLHGLVISSCWADTGNQSSSPSDFCSLSGQHLLGRAAGGWARALSPSQTGGPRANLLFIQGCMYVAFCPYTRDPSLPGGHADPTGDRLSPTRPPPTLDTSPKSHGTHTSDQPAINQGSHHRLWFRDMSEQLTGLWGTVYLLDDLFITEDTPQEHQMELLPGARDGGGRRASVPSPGALASQHLRVLSAPEAL